MNYFLFWFLFGLAVGVIVGLAIFWVCQMWGKKKKADSLDQKYLDQILALFNKHEKLTNMIVRQELGINDRMVVRCMDELQARNEVEQVGDTGSGVYYRRKK